MTDGERRRATQRSRYSPPRVTPVTVHLPDANSEPWTPLESLKDVTLFQRNSSKSWHGLEFMVVKNGIVVYATFDLSNAYIQYHNLVQ